MLTNKALNGWNLFWLIAGPISVIMLIAMIGADMSTGPGISSMIGLSVRFAVPLVFVTFAARALQTLFPGSFSRWLLRNRKYIGLSFAAAMAWQGLFIVWMLTIHTGYYVNEVYVMRDAIEGAIGYLLLASMTITSFSFARKQMSARSWRVLHTAGIYFLWAYAFIVYWWALFYYSNPVPLDYLYYGAGVAAWVLRAAAWGKKLRQDIEKGKGNPLNPAFQPVGGIIIGVGLFATIFGSLWSSTAQELLYGYSLTRIPELYLPYWPFEPFLPLAIIAAGILLVSGAKPAATMRTSADAQSTTAA